MSWSWLWLLAALLLLVGIAQSLAMIFRWAKAFGAALVVILLGIAAANTGLIPTQHRLYTLIFQWLVPLALFLLLLRVRLLSLRTVGIPLLLAFSLGSLTTVIGVIIGLQFFGHLFGSEAWKVAGVFTGTYIGGGINYIAIAKGLAVSDNLFAGGAAADNVVTAIWMAICLWAPRFWGSGAEGMSSEESDPTTEPAVPDPSLPKMGTPYEATLRWGCLLVIAPLVLSASWWLEGAIPQIPSILFITTVAVILAQFPFFNMIPGVAPMGHFFMLLFFASLGAICDIREMLRFGVAIFLFAAVVVIFHGLSLYFIGRALGIDRPTLCVASQACVGGAPSALAVAETHNWRPLLGPSVLVGVFGYGIGNYIGYAVAYLYRLF